VPVWHGGKNSALLSFRTSPRADSVHDAWPVNKIIQINRETFMKTTTVFVGLLLASALASGSAIAQPAPFNETGVTMGHWHLISKDVEANKKILLGMGGKLYMPGGAPLMMFPGVYINLNLGTEKGEGGSQGSVVNHVGFIVNNVQEQVAKWKAAGVAVLPGTNNRPDQAFVETPDGLRIEILEDKTQSMPIRNEHVHFFLPEEEIPKAQDWYAKTFGGKAGTRNNAPVVDGIPGVQLRFAKADRPQTEEDRGGRHQA
jgi:catechol 2,3-dioxygenase-like lactoylglutathione lyase family enzyme